MWVLVLLTLISMTIADTFESLHTLLLTAEINTRLIKIWKWDYRKHDLGNTMDGLADIASAFAIGGTAFSLISLGGSTSNPTIIFHFSGWTVLTALAMVVGSQIGGTFGEIISRRVAGATPREMQHVTLKNAAHEIKIVKKAVDKQNQDPVV